jgi:hypothetical protein
MRSNNPQARLPMGGGWCVIMNASGRAAMSFIVMAAFVIAFTGLIVGGLTRSFHCFGASAPAGRTDEQQPRTIG